MKKEELAKRLMATFLEELHEHVGALSDNLLALEKSPADPQRRELLKSLFRSAHSLKGAARSVNAALVAQACHRLEDVLADVRDDRRAFTPELFALFFEAADAIEEAGMRLRDEQDLDASPLSALLPKLDRAAGAERPSETKPRAVTDNPQPAGDAPGTTTLAAEEQRRAAAEPATVSPAPVAAAGGQVGPDADAVARPAVEKVIAGASKTATTIRVASEKLDSLLAHSGELLVARRRVEMRGADVSGLRDWVAAWRTEWREAEKPLRRLFAGEAADDPSLRPREWSRRTTTFLEQTGPRLKQLEKQLDQLAANVVSDGRVLASACDALDDEVYHVRMLPFAEACGGLERAVRDLAQAAGKNVELVVRGEDIEVDRSVLEGLKDPLMHLVRNAVDHGVESPDERRAAGKPARATVTVSAALRGGHVEVIVADDGRGFDADGLREKLRSKGLAEPEDDRQLARMAFLPGISTASIVTDVSGRGVGLDVVEDRIESLHGSVDVSFRAGAGTRFTMAVPLTLTTIRCVLVMAGGQTYAIATANVHQFIRFRGDDLRSVAGRDVLLLGQTPVPIASLADTLGQPGPAPKQPSDHIPAVILASADQRIAFVVDQFLTEQEVLVKNLGTRIRRVRHLAGATLLPTGKVALVLNAANIVRTALGQTARRPVADADTAAKQKRRRLLVVEDSLTTRTLMKSILETAGYETLVAVDGEQAWQLLAEDPVDLVVADVDMPRMDGFELTSAIRRSERFAELPVVLVTARGSDQDKKQGLEVGANAYLVKAGFDQTNLLETVAQLL